MLNLEIGQELEFVESAHTADGTEIPKGTRVRVGAFTAELLESKVTLVVLNRDSPKVLTVAKHIVTMHCRPVQASR